MRGSTKRCPRLPDTLSLCPDTQRVSGSLCVSRHSLCVGKSLTGQALFVCVTYMRDSFCDADVWLMLLGCMCGRQYEESCQEVLTWQDSFVGVTCKCVTHFVIRGSCCRVLGAGGGTVSGMAGLVRMV